MHRQNCNMCCNQHLNMVPVNHAIASIPLYHYGTVTINKKLYRFLFLNISIMVHAGLFLIIFYFVTVSHFLLGLNYVNHNQKWTCCHIKMSIFFRYNVIAYYIKHKLIRYFLKSTIRSNCNSHIKIKNALV